MQLDEHEHGYVVDASDRQGVVTVKCGVQDVNQGFVVVMQL